MPTTKNCSESTAYVEDATWQGRDCAQCESSLIATSAFLVACRPSQFYESAMAKV